MALKLDIGGTIFKTSRSTLTKYDCMFRGMLESGIQLETDESGCIFIDRDPTHFRYILNFMRDGTVKLPENQDAIEEILKEAEFYLIQELIDFCINHELHLPDKSKEDYRVVKNYTELAEILIGATREVLVIIFPFQFGGPVLQHATLKWFTEKHKHRMDIVFIENTDKQTNGWRYQFHEFEDKLKSYGYPRQEMPPFHEFLDNVDQNLPSSLQK